MALGFASSKTVSWDFNNLWLILNVQVPHVSIDIKAIALSVSSRTGGSQRELIMQSDGGSEAQHQCQRSVAVNAASEIIRNGKAEKIHEYANSCFVNLCRLLDETISAVIGSVTHEADPFRNDRSVTAQTKRRGI